MAIAWEDVQKDIPKCRAYDEMIVGAIGSIDEDGGSSKEAISTHISSCYTNLPHNHLSRVIKNLDKLLQRKLIGVNDGNFYFLQPSGQEWFNDLDVPFKNDGSFHHWKRPIKTKSMKEIMQETEPKN